jgi:hypothetical protein
MVVDDEEWPRLVAFAIPLRDPLPVSHHTTITRSLAEEISEALPMVVTSGGPQLPTTAQGHQFVSLRFWQLQVDRTADEQLLVDASMAVLDSPEADDVEPNTDHGDDYRTIVEAVTYVASPEDLTATEDRPDPLTRCLTVLFDMVRAYRLADDVLVSELTYERVGPIIPFRYRPLGREGFLGGPQLMLLEHANVPVPAPAVWGAGEHDRYVQHLERLLAGDPLMLYVERRLEARLALHRDGQYAESAIQSAIAAEVLLRGVLSMLVWEESAEHDEDVDPAAEILRVDTTRRVKREYPPRLGGTWSLVGDGPVARWYRDTAGLRNRVVHAGHRPSKDQAVDALEALLALERFVCDRLADRSRRYPRTALTVLGGAGLERRGAWSDAVFGEAVLGPVLSSVQDFSEWRGRVDERIFATEGRTAG